MILETIKELFTTFTYSLLLLFSLFRAWFANLLADLDKWIPEPLNGYEEYLPPLDVWIYATCFLCLVLLHTKLRRVRRERDAAHEVRILEEGVYVPEKGRGWSPRSHTYINDSKLKQESQRHWSPPAYPWPVHVHHES